MLAGLLTAGCAIYAVIFFIFGAMSREEMRLMKRQIWTIA
jgi:hypothetical protein